MLSRNELHIYPTSRALREISIGYKQQEGFIPTLMRMDEFENRVTRVEEKRLVDTLQRILFLREAARFERFKKLNVDLDLIRFFTRSDAIFKFFEELTAEKVSFEKLREADAYAEFDQHLDILEELLANYRTLLESRGLTDRAFLPIEYRLNEGFIQNYQKIEIHLEGYLSRHEFELLERVSQKTPLWIHYTTSRFNQKMQERFESYGIELPTESEVTVDFSTKKVLHASPVKSKIDAVVYQVNERTEQIAFAYEQIEKLVQEGISPEKIVLILPDENFKAYFALYDRFNNLNFAMGYDYTQERGYKCLEALYGYWRSYEKEYWILLERYGVDLGKVEQVKASKHCGVEDFMDSLSHLELLDVPRDENRDEEIKYDERIYEKYLHFIHTFKDEYVSHKEWLYLWMQALSEVTLDDVRGGKVTVMGVLETRGVSFDGVVIVDFNDGIVPASSSKDQFLNSSVRAFAGLPTRNDREALQKQYYKRLLEQAKQSVILYSTAENRLPSKFLYELGLKEIKEAEGSLELLYNELSQVVAADDPMVDSFDAGVITWSASRLKTFLECKRKYYYRYIQKIEAKKEEEKNEGWWLHTFLEHLFKGQNSFSSKEQMQEKLYRLMDSLLDQDDAKTNYRKLLWKEKLHGFIERQIAHFEAGWQVVEREKEFIGEIGGLKFKGRIDRIDQDATQTLVLDYKSGSTTEAQKSRNLENLKDFQMSIYHHLLEKKYQNVSLAFVKLFEGGKVEEITALEAKNELLAEHIVELKQTTSFVAEKCEKLATCTYCEYQLMCERGEYL